ncbi:MAG: hypothetical protein HYU36_21765 [Planctomycetes bacterium]|nr:hypothetical protein [Planctomycetota bacterium]
MEKTLTTKSTRKTAVQDPVYTKIREDSKKETRKYVEGWKVPKGAE